MSSDLKSINRKDASKFLSDILFDYLDTHGYLGIIYGTRGQIPGFTKKNASKAPITMIKNIAKKRVRLLSDATKFLDNYTMKVSDNYQGLKFEEFYTKIQTDGEVTEGEKVALFFLLYQDEYQKKLDRIKENIKYNRLPLTNIISLSLIKKLRSIYVISENGKINNTTKFNELLEIDKETFNIIESKNITLKDQLENNTLPPINKGHYLALYKTFLRESDKWEEEEQIVFLKLVINDSLRLLDKQFDENKNLKTNFENELENTQKENFQLDEKLKTYKNKQSLLQTKISKLNDNIDDFKHKYSLLNRQYDELKKENMRLIDVNNSFNEKLEKLQVNNNELKKEYNRQVDLQKLHLFKNDNIYLMTKIKDDKFSVFFTEDQIIQLNNDTELLENIHIKEHDAIYFLNIDGISTRESFKIENPLIENKLTYRIVSGGIKNIIRKVIYYLEGELRNEVKEKY
ncbi:MAG: hypothetical protein GX347_09060 [Epulopiscium sp.]|nr:hypothetical protein [Candidatus Epulonipiscium sp.]